MNIEEKSVQAALAVAVSAAACYLGVIIRLK